MPTDGRWDLIQGYKG